MREFDSVNEATAMARVRATVDLHVFTDHPAAAAMLHLARGQLNLAYRNRGMQPPNPLSNWRPAAVDTADLDDPVARGLEYARARYDDAFATWEATMPADFVAPILAILQRAHIALSRQPGPNRAGAATRDAVTLLQGILAGQE